MSWAVILILRLAGFGGAEASVLAPQVVTLISTAYSIYKFLRARGFNAGDALSKVGSMIGEPHKMTAEEEKLWMDHASDAGAGGG